MKRSEINKAIEDAIIFFKKMNFSLPPYAFWTQKEWIKNKKHLNEIIKTQLGWDVTDFGLGDFEKFGRTIFTLRNGKPPEYSKVYAQKVMFLKEGQKSPVHFHKSKMEDIFSQGPGNILIKFWLANKKGRALKKDFYISVDGVTRLIPPGRNLVLYPGDSVCIKPYTYHQYWAQKKKGDVLSIEVSSVNDDKNDNFWFQKAVRFPKIVEDEPKRYLLVTDY